MTPLDFRSKRFRLRALLWSGLLFGSQCEYTWTGGSTSEVLVLGSPVIHIPTITITTTIAYRPTLVPGDAKYTLLGCYSQPGGNSGGCALSQEISPETVSERNLTIGACLEGCASLTPPNKTSEYYAYVGLRNGSECFCGTGLSSEIRKLSNDDCKSPCTGDAKLSCGGNDTIAIYSLVGSGSGDTKPIYNDVGPGDKSGAKGGNVNSGGGSNSDSDRSTKTNDGKDNTSKSNVSQPTSASSPSSPTPTTAVSNVLKATTQSTSATTASQAPDKANAGASATAPTDGPLSPPPPGSAGPPASTPTIAAITGSMSGAIIVAALCILCFRAYKRKKARQDAHVRIVLHRQEHQQKHKPRISTSAAERQPLSPGHRLHDDQTQDERDGSSNTVPTTPALESGGADRDRDGARSPYHAGLHARLATATTPTTTKSGSDRDSLYSVLLGEVRAGPAGTSYVSAGTAMTAPSTPSFGLSTSTHADDNTAGASSAVQLRPQAVPSTPNTYTHAHNHGSESGPSRDRRAPWEVEVEGQGEKETVRTPNPTAQQTHSLGDRAWHRRKISTAFQPPPGSPPSIPLPPTPRRQRQRSLDAFEPAPLLLKPDTYSGPSFSSSHSRQPSTFTTTAAAATSPGRRTGEPGPETRGNDPGPAPAPAPFYALSGLDALANLSSRSLPTMSEDHHHHHHHHHHQRHPFGKKAHERGGHAVPSTPPLVDSPTLPRTWYGAKSDTRSGDARDGIRRVGDGGGHDGAGRVPPKLPPIAPGEEFDSRRWRGTVYGEGQGQGLGEERGEQRRDERGRDRERDRWSPVSASSVGTSILFPDG
ncbi:hypothetical protein F4779DRAFT_307277 [Xylariaceae sp. FL0662B]|nr:hypothetical protein F4779DRAFT_307277 [Xylariaceae sp. FL0662B]